MAVYTPLDAPTLKTIADAFGLGEVREAFGIAQGSINTNYRLETASGRVFLRHTTVRSEADLTFEAALLSHLEEAAVPAPRLRLAKNGAAWLPILGGYVSLFGWLAGEELRREDAAPEELEQLGRTLAKMHLASMSFTGTRPNPYGPQTVQGWIRGLLGHEDAELRSIAEELAADLEEVTAAHPHLEPRGVIHADLFVDNVKWLGGRVSALFDFEMACVDAFGLDVAITLNAWCFEEGAYRWERVRAFLAGYQDVRPLESSERQRLRTHARFGAVRYCASRIRDFHLSPLPPERLARKDFRTYLARTRILRGMSDEAWQAKVFR